MKTNKTVSFLVNGLAYLLCLVWLVPIVWMAVVALKPESVDVTRVSNWFRPPFTTENLRAVLEHPQADVFRWIANSAAVAVLTTCGVLLVCTLAAFAFSRIRFPGKNAVFVLVMVGMMIPARPCWCRSTPCSRAWGF